MAPDREDTSKISPEAREGQLAKWTSPRRIRFWVIVGLALYTLAGFFGVPYLAGNYLADTAGEDLGRAATAREIRFNPYTLRFAIHGFEFSDRDGERLAAFDEFVVDFQLSSLFRWAWTFREVRLDGAFVFFERFAPGDSRLGRLLTDIEALSAGEPKDSDVGLPRLLIHNLELNRGSAKIVDQVPDSAVELAAGPVSVSIQQLNTLPDRFGRQSVQIRLPGETTLGWQGSISLAPLHSEGELVIENSHLDQTIAYLKAILPLDAVRATLSARTRYRISQRPDGGLDLGLEGLDLELTGVVVTGLQPSTEFLSFTALEVRGGALHYPERALSLPDVVIRDPRSVAWLDESGRLSLLDLAPPQTVGEKPDGEPVPAVPEWKVSIDRFAVENGRLEMNDYSVNPAAAITADAIKLSLTGIDNSVGTVIPLSLGGRLEGGGGFEFDGGTMVLPAFRLEGKATLADIPLQPAQPYIGRVLHVQVDDGRLSAEADVKLQPGEQATMGGNLAVEGLNVIDSLENEALLAWESMSIDRFEADATAGDIRLSRVDFKRPYGRIEINPDRTTNLDGLLVKNGGGDSSGGSEDGTPPGLLIGGIEIADGVMDFSDLSLPLAFSTQINDLDGTVSTIDTGSGEPAVVRLEGQVDEYGLARIDGDVNLLDPVAHTNVNVEFRNLAMSDLSPYTVQFAGRKIDEGKLDLDLQYAVDGGQLQGQNDIVLSDLVLGEAVEHPDAASLPLGLAVALLKDANGVIDIDLPVEGDVNDPEFRVGGIVWQAIAGLITKVVAAPFRLLGSLIGIESEDLGRFQFLAGRYDLTPPELEKISQLQQALQQRPQLTVEISGVYDVAVDGPALQFFQLRDTALARMGETPGDRDDEQFEMLDEEIRSTLEALFTERYASTPLESLKAEYTAPPADDPEGKPVFDQLAYAAGLWDRLLASEQVSQADLETLAGMRAATLRDRFLATGELDAGRVLLAAPVAVESEDSEWVAMELGVAAD